MNFVKFPLKDRTDGQVVFGGTKRPPCLEIFSLRKVCVTELKAYVFYSFEKAVCLLRNFKQKSVDKSYRGHGIAAKLCNHVEDLARKQGKNLFLGKLLLSGTLIHLKFSETSCAQLPAIKLYKKLGYRDEARPHSWVIDLVACYKVVKQL